MNTSIVSIVAFVTVAVVAGLMLWSRRRRSADDTVASLQEEVPPAARREPGTEVRVSGDDRNQNAAPKAESHKGTVPDRGSWSLTEDGKRILLPPALIAPEEGADESRLSDRVMTKDVLEIEAPSQDADLPTEIPVTAPSEADTDTIEMSPGASAAKTHAIEEADSGEEQTIEHGSSPAAAAMPVSEDARARMEFK